MVAPLHIAHVTGSARVIRNHFATDHLAWRSRRTVGQMFFQPYESQEEFLFCARHNLIGAGLLRAVLLSGIVALPMVVGGISATCLALAVVSRLCGNDNGAILLAVAEALMVSLCQSLIDLVVLPLSALMMVTRGASTGLQAISGDGAPLAPAV